MGKFTLTFDASSHLPNIKRTCLSITWVEQSLGFNSTSFSKAYFSASILPSTRQDSRRLLQIKAPDLTGSIPLMNSWASSNLPARPRASTMQEQCSSNASIP